MSWLGYVRKRRVVLFNMRNISEGEESAFCDQQPCHVLNDYLIRKLFTCSDSHSGIHHWCKHQLQWSYTHSCQQWVWLRGPIPVPWKHRYQSQTSMDYSCLKMPPFTNVLQFTLEPKQLDEKSNSNFHLDHAQHATLWHSFYLWLSASAYDSLSMCNNEMEKNYSFVFDTCLKLTFLSSPPR